MLASVDESLEAFLRAVVPLSSVDIDVSFETPSEEWAAKLTRPTVNLYLWDVRRSTGRAVTGMEQVERNGVPQRRMMLPRLDLRYFVSVWTTEHDDERTLIGAIVVALLAHSEIPGDFVVPTLAELMRPQLQLARTGDAETFTLDRTKFGLQLGVVAAVDTDLGVPLAPGVADIEIGIRNRPTGATTVANRRVAGEVADLDAIGTTVRSPLGVTTVNAQGKFLIRARTGDEIVVETDPPLSVVVPPSGGVVVRA